MKLIGFAGQLVCSILCLYCCVGVETTECDNEAGYCETFYNYLNCYVNNNDTQLITTLLRNCSNMNTTFHTISVYKNYISVAHRYLVIDGKLSLFP